MTTRDDVWNAVLDLVAEEGAFRRSDLPFDDSQRHTVRRTLKQMEELDWLYRTDEMSPIWRAGPKAKNRLRLSEKARDAADSDADG